MYHSYKHNQTKQLACKLNETISKVEELSQLAKKINKGNFEGNWQSCFSFAEDELAERYGSTPICVDNFLIQKANNICGTLEYCASGRSSGGNARIGLKTMLL